MKTLRKVILALLGASLLLYGVIVAFHIQMTSASGGCRPNLCSSNAHTDYWAVTLYALLGLLFIASVLLSMALAVWRLRTLRKPR